MHTKILTDADSLINFNRYFIFDKNDSSRVYNNLLGFFVEKVVNNEIIIIDKVFEELQNRPEIRNFKRVISKHKYSTVHLLNKIEPILEENIVQINLQRFGDWEIEIMKQDYKNKHADLYLIALCEELISQDINPIVVTEETINRDKKIVEKLPTICKRKNITCKNLPFLLFDFYKEQLKFDLTVQNN
jgi:hypothetical protein